MDLVKQARELMDGTTPGPWEIEKYRREEYWFPDDHYSVGPAIVDDEADARFIAATRELVPQMADRIKALESALRDIAWSNDTAWQADRARAALEGK